ncbi:MAG TPA: CvpA family protein [Chloroflexia bacterium]|jgi:membrane protein required for colicin V production|nr:CvpA family protein [Chloroflexia bacterium]
MNWVDVTILTAIVVSALLGLFWGLIRQIAATFGLILAIFLAGANYKAVAAFLHPPQGGGLIADENLANIIAFVLILVGVSLAVGIVASVLRTALGLLFLGWADHLLGALLGVFQMLLLMAVIIMVATLFPVPGLSDAVRQSTLAPAVARPFTFVLDWLPPEFGLLRFLLNTGG